MSAQKVQFVPGIGPIKEGMDPCESCKDTRAAFVLRVVSNGTERFCLQCLTCGRNRKDVKKAGISEEWRAKAGRWDAERSKRHWEEQNRARRAEWDAKCAEREAERQRENAEFWRKYSAYLLTAQWREKRRKVLERCKGVCEACEKAPAVQAHHTTYRHVFAEPLFEFKGVCMECHEKITEMDRAARSDRIAQWQPGESQN